MSKSKKAAEAMVPVGLLAQHRDKVVAWVARGYMAGHAAHTRWANKNWQARRAEVERVAAELVDYLDDNSLNSVGAESILHRKLRNALNGAENAPSGAGKQE